MPICETTSDHTVPVCRRSCNLCTRQGDRGTGDTAVSPVHSRDRELRTPQGTQGTPAGGNGERLILSPELRSEMEEAGELKSYWSSLGFA